jgi:hypothetical protein
MSLSSSSHLLTLFLCYSITWTNFFLASYSINLLELDLLSICLFSNNYRLKIEESKWTIEWVGEKKEEEKRKYS